MFLTEKFRRQNKRTKSKNKTKISKITNFSYFLWPKNKILFFLQAHNNGNYFFNYSRKNGPTPTGKVYESEHHNLQEYTYKKITPCDVCSQVLRGMNEGGDGGYDDGVVI